MEKIELGDLQNQKLKIENFQKIKLGGENFEITLTSMKFKLAKMP